MTEQPDLYTEFMDAFRAFTGAFDTPIARRRQSNELAEDARERLRQFAQRFTTLRNQLGPFTEAELRLSAVREALRAMTEEERTEVYRDYCYHCGTYQADHIRGCQCWNDE
ncbi:hypothetical protein [Ralstonia phage phiRSL1]|uniref:Uncharacterized protein n=1 Tax=Ralstonia phage phiRSL1 TaxID=1980924 RepID=B2ZXT0_9CAUD|nr:hypothetical protein RSL1_ORF041 [Ralstonia phage phiRSL1]BAG41486.1 hypothetical protein [Ralstonia phage phiRSL1]